jgi:long-chain acyl-CoA synthetase
VLRPADHELSGPHAHRLRAAGLPLDCLEIRVVDPVALSDVEPGRVGEIWVRGPTVMTGYWRKPGLTAETIVDGWLRSGDAGYLDRDGYLYLHDRVKDMIVSGGENIYPAEIENALAAHPAVLESAVIAVPDERWGETPKALVVRLPGADVTDRQLIAHCKERLASYKCPTSVEWIAELPRNAAGKVLKKTLRAPYWEAAQR